MTTATYSYHPFHSIGAAKVLLWDSAAGGGLGAWHSLGRVADCAVLVSGEAAEKSIAVRGVSQPISKRPRSRRYSLSCRLLELSGPEAQALLFGEGAAQGKKAADITVQGESLRLFGQQQHELAHPYGLLSDAPPPVTSPAASAGGSGGTIAASSYHYWIVPFLSYGGAVQFTGQAAYAGSVNVSSGQQVTLTFTAPASYTPSGYRIYFATSNNISVSRLTLETSSGSPIVLSSHTAGALYAAPLVPPFKLLSNDGLSTYSGSSDYSLDIQRGLLARASASTVPAGSSVVALYPHYNSAQVSTPVGRHIAPERYRKLRLVQLAPQDQAQQGLGAGDLDPASWRETGVEFEFYRVAITPGETRWPFAESDFGEGASLLWDCMHDGESGAVGIVRSSFGVLAQWS